MNDKSKLVLDLNDFINTEILEGTISGPLPTDFFDKIGRAAVRGLADSAYFIRHNIVTEGKNSEGLSKLIRVGNAKPDTAMQSFIRALMDDCKEVEHELGG